MNEEKKKNNRRRPRRHHHRGGQKPQKDGAQLPREERQSQTSPAPDALKDDILFADFNKERTMEEDVPLPEGYDFDDVTFPIRVMHLLGAEKLVVTNASGCVNKDWKAGELMLIADHIKFMLDSPLCGPKIPEFGPRFPDSSYNYSPALRTMAKEGAKELGIKLHEGVYMYMPGPQYETPAEIRAARILGADAVGMSTAPEVIVARHCGMEVLGLTLLTNMAAGILDQPLSEEEVLSAAANAREKFSKLVLGCLEKL
jgi:purine-nucleoside phosphorylase